MTGNEILNNYAATIAAEYDNAVAKHPTFAKFWTNDKDSVQDTMEYLQLQNNIDEADDAQAVDSVLEEEMLEAFNAMRTKDAKNLKEELTQVIAVCLRALNKLDSKN